MGDIELLLGLVAATAVLVSIARAIDVPFPIVLVVGGIVIGLLPGVPEIELDPDLVLLVFIPPLVHASAWVASPRHLRAFARPGAGRRLDLPVEKTHRGQSAPLQNEKFQSIRLRQ